MIKMPTVDGGDIWITEHRSPYGGRSDFTDQRKFVLNERAQMAQQMAVHWGSQPGEPAGAIAEKAADTAAILWEMFEVRGWITKLPNMAEIEPPPVETKD